MRIGAKNVRVDSGHDDGVFLAESSVVEGVGVLDLLGVLVVLTFKVERVLDA